MLGIGLAACSPGAGAPDGGDDALPQDAVPSNQPIVAPVDAWTWVDFAESRCASGAPTGIGINPHAGSTDLVLFLKGGGLCFDAASCWGGSPTSMNLAGYDATVFANEPRVHNALFDRSAIANPMANMNLVFIPYCTGDMHSGTREVDLQQPDGGAPIPTYFWGANNLDVFLARLVPTFPDVKHVWLLGTSAGGMGAILNFEKVIRAFPNAQVDIIDDSGPPVTFKGANDNAGLFATWAYLPPTACSGCSSLRAVYDFDRQERPSSRYGFLSFSEDSIVSLYFGYTVAEFTTILNDFSASIASDPNAATFFVTNDLSHVVENDATLAPQFEPWIAQMMSGAAWSDQTYVHP